MTRFRKVETAHPHDARERTSSELRAITVGGKTEMLPGDPVAIAKILIERRAKMTPAQRAKSKMAAAIAKRGS